MKFKLEKKCHSNYSTLLTLTTLSFQKNEVVIEDHDHRWTNPPEYSNVKGIRHPYPKRLICDKKNKDGTKCQEISVVEDLTELYPDEVNRIWMGVIAQAYRDIVHSNPDVRKDALDWFFSADNLFPSFLCLCDCFSLKAGVLRENVRTLFYSFEDLAKKHGANAAKLELLNTCRIHLPK